MTTTNHQPAPPEGKFKRWEDDILNERDNVDHVLDCAWKDGYRAGADAKLDECCEWMITQQYPHASALLRAAMQPKPPSLAEQGLEALEQIDGWAVSNMNHLSIHDDLVTGVEAIRTALERLKELEKGNG